MPRAAPSPKGSTAQAVSVAGLHNQMPTLNPQIKVTLTVDEVARLREQANSGESDSNLIRRKLKLKPLKQGAPKGNHNARRSTTNDR